MTVLSRAEREVVLTIRRPDQPATETTGPTVHERVMVVCRHRRYLAMAARDGDEMVIGGVGESRRPGQADRRDLPACSCRRWVITRQPTSRVSTCPRTSCRRRVEAAAAKRRKRSAAALRPGRSGPVGGRGRPGGHRPRDVGDGGGRGHRPRRSSCTRIRGCSLSPTPSTAGSASPPRPAPTAREWLSIWPTTPASLRQDLADLLAAPQLV